MYVRQLINKTEFTVQDHGIGMDSEMLNSLFIINENKSRTGTNGEKGTGLGLGLLLCKDFIDKHNGEICDECQVFFHILFITEKKLLLIL